jgi:hypothetical protein
MAALADHVVKKKSPTDVWKIGEDATPLYHPGLRSMADPRIFGDPDHYTERWMVDSCTYTNAGIIDKAFYLMVEGGIHDMEWIEVPPLSADFNSSIIQAANIFFNAVTKCLPETSGFHSMRECTLLHSSASQKPTVQKAWTAVGIREILILQEGVPFTGISLPLVRDSQVLVLDKTVGPGQSVTCRLNKGEEKSLELFVRFGLPPDLSRWSILPPAETHNRNHCTSSHGSMSTTEECTTRNATAPNSKVYVAVETYKPASDFELTCTINGTPQPLTPPPCRANGNTCTSRAECCSRTCDGPTPATRVCKACKKRNRICTRSTECCSGLRCRNRRCA